MSFAQLSALVFGAGLLGLAAVLYLLQRLRVRHRQQAVVTTLFWREAVHEARAQRLVHRFRHPLAYAFITLIAWLMWLAYADPRVERGESRDWVLLLDGSSATSATRLQQAITTLTADLARMPPAHTRVLWCGAIELPLLLPGERAELFARRVARLSPAAAEPCVVATLQRLAHQQPHRPTTVRVFGDAPIDTDTLALLPATFQVERVQLDTAPALANRALRTLGVSDAASGAWDRIDIAIEAAGTPPPQLLVTLDGAAVTPAISATPDGVSARLRDVPARGQHLVVAIAGADDQPLDDRAERLLPRRTRVRVALSATLDDALRPALAADPAVELVSGDADVAVRRAGESIDGRAALEFTPLAGQPQAFLITHDQGASEDVLLRALDQLGLDEIDASALADNAGRTIAVAAERGAGRRVSVWQELLDEPIGLVTARAFPMFVARAVRWLADAPPLEPEIRVGTPLVEARAGLVDGEGRRIDAAGAPLTPLRAGEYRDASGATLLAALLPSAPPAEDLPATPASPARGRLAGIDPMTWALLVALLLLAIEWVLFRAERIP